MPMPYPLSSKSYGGGGSSSTYTSPYGFSGSSMLFGRHDFARSQIYGGATGLSLNLGFTSNYSIPTSYSHVSPYGVSSYSSYGGYTPSSAPKSFYSPMPTISEHSSGGGSSANKRRIPRTYIPVLPLPSPAGNRPALYTSTGVKTLYTEDIDVTTPRKTAQPGEINRERNGEGYGTIRRGRTVIRLETKKLKENPYLPQAEDASKEKAPEPEVIVPPSTEESPACIPNSEEKKPEPEAEPQVVLTNGHHHEDAHVEDEDKSKEQFFKDYSHVKKWYNEEIRTPIKKERNAGDKFREKYMVHSKKNKYAGYRRPTLSDIRAQKAIVMKEIEERLTKLTESAQTNNGPISEEMRAEAEKLEKDKEKLARLDKKMAKRFSRALRKAEKVGATGDSSDDESISTSSVDRQVTVKPATGARKQSAETIKNCELSSSSTSDAKKEDSLQNQRLTRKVTKRFFFPQEACSVVQPEILDTHVPFEPEDLYEKNILAQRQTIKMRSVQKKVAHISSRKSSASDLEIPGDLLSKVSDKLCDGDIIKLEPTEEVQEEEEKSPKKPSSLKLEEEEEVNPFNRSSNPSGKKKKLVKKVGDPPAKRVPGNILQPLVVAPKDSDSILDSPTEEEKEEIKKMLEDEEKERSLRKKKPILNKVNGLISVTQQKQQAQQLVGGGGKPQVGKINNNKISQKLQGKEALINEKQATASTTGVGKVPEKKAEKITTKSENMNPEKKDVIPEKISETVAKSNMKTDVEGSSSPKVKDNVEHELEVKTKQDEKEKAPALLLPTSKSKLDETNESKLNNANAMSQGNVEKTEGNCSLEQGKKVIGVTAEPKVEKLEENNKSPLIAKLKPKLALDNKSASFDNGKPKFKLDNKSNSLDGEGNPSNSVEGKPKNNNAAGVAKKVADKAKPELPKSPPAKDLAPKVKENAKNVKNVAGKIEEAKPEVVVEVKNKLMEDKNKPVEDKSKPVEVKNKPVEDKNKPVEDKNKPVEDKSKPAADKNKPAEDKKAGTGAEDKTPKAFVPSAELKKDVNANDKQNIKSAPKDEQLNTGKKAEQDPKKVEEKMAEEKAAKKSSPPNPEVTTPPAKQNLAPVKVQEKNEVKNEGKSEVKIEQVTTIATTPEKSGLDKIKSEVISPPPSPKGKFFAKKEIAPMTPIDKTKAEVKSPPPSPKTKLVPEQKEKLDLDLKSPPPGKKKLNESKDTGKTPDVQDKPSVDESKETPKVLKVTPVPTKLPDESKDGKTTFNKLKSPPPPSPMSSPKQLKDEVKPEKKENLLSTPPPPISTSTTPQTPAHLPPGEKKTHMPVKNGGLNIKDSKENKHLDKDKDESVAPATGQNSEKTLSSPPNKPLQNGHLSPPPTSKEKSNSKDQPTTVGKQQTKSPQPCETTQKEGGKVDLGCITGNAPNGPEKKKADDIISQDNIGNAQMSKLGSISATSDKISAQKTNSLQENQNQDIVNGDDDDNDKDDANVRVLNKNLLSSENGKHEDGGKVGNDKDEILVANPLLKSLIRKSVKRGSTQSSGSSSLSSGSSTSTAKSESGSSTSSTMSAVSLSGSRRAPSPPIEDMSEDERITLDKICPAKTRPKYRKYEIEDFQFLKVLGKGSFGKVLLAELKGSDSYFAIKCLKKDVVLEDDDVECTMIERKVLLMGSKHPYLCHLFCTFQTESHLFFVMEYLNGGDLMFHIQQSGRFTEERARFYGAEIVSGLKFLHKRGVIYRDLKLDNILLDYEGHIRIADFGMCKLQIYLDRMADTFCGTPDYMAPEIIKGLRYNQCVDCGHDEDELFWSVCNEPVHYPRFLSKESKRLLELLLEKDASKRLGTVGCIHGDVKEQPFFQPIDWERLERRDLEPPFKPKLKHSLDVQYFDTTFTKEAARLTPVDKEILRSMDQTQFEGFSYTNPHTTD